MTTYLTFVLDLASKDPRIPGFQGFTILPDASVRVLYRHGLKSFDSLEMVHLWLVKQAKMEPVTEPLQALASPS